MNPRTVIAALALAYFQLHAAAEGVAPKPADQPLKPDPNLVEGMLPDGMHYLILPNHNRPQVSMWLRVNVGSGDETAQEHGLAHFLEHMAFDGSEHFPAGALVKRFAQFGMTVGKHENAYTDFDQTVFQVSLPQVSAEGLRTCLLFLSDVASRLDLAPAEIEPEKKVVLEEIRARSGADRQKVIGKFSSWFAGTSLGDHDTLGTDADVKGFSRDAVLAFYKREYRPENITLIIVGDVKPADIAALVSTTFEEEKETGKHAAQSGPAPATGPESSALGQTAQAVHVVTVPDLAEADVSIASKQAAHPVDSVAALRHMLSEQLVQWILSRRLDDRRQSGNAPFVDSNFTVANLTRSVHLSTAEVNGEAAKWSDMLQSLDLELRRVQEFGFTAQEIGAAKAALLAGAKYEVQTAATRDSRELIGELNYIIGQGMTPVGPEQMYALTRELLADIQEAELRTCFDDDFGPEHRITTVIIPLRPDVAPPAEKDVQSAIAAVAKMPVHPLPAAVAVEPLLLADPAVPDQAPSIAEDKALGVLTVTLGNRAVIHYRQSDQQKNEVMIKVTLPGGEIEETAENRGITQLVAAALDQTATARLSSLKLERLLDDKCIQFNAEAEPDCLSLTVIATKDEAQNAFRLLNAVLESAVVENSAVETWRQKTVRLLETQQSDVNALDLWAVRANLFSNDPRRSPIPMANVLKFQAKDAQAWMDRLLRNTPLEAAVVGDISSQKALPLANRYLGSLPVRLPLKGYLADRRKLAIPHKPAVQVTRAITASNDAIVTLCYRGVSAGHESESDILEVVGRVLADRLRLEIRVKQGLTYAVRVSSQPGDAYPEIGAFAINLSCDPDKVDKVVETLDRVVADFVKTGPTRQELEVASRQFALEVQENQRSSYYWLQRLARLDYANVNLGWLNNRAQAIMAIKDPEAVRKIASFYFTPERRILVMSRPSNHPA